MTYKIILSCLVVVILAACGPTKKEPAPIEPTNELVAFSAITDAYYEEYLKFHPLQATMQGDNRFDAELPNDISRAHRQRLKSYYTRYINQLDEYPIRSMPQEDQDNWEILRWECEVHLRELEFKTHLTPINQFKCLPLTIGQLASGSSAQPFETVEHYENWLSRVDDFTEWCDTAIANMKRGIELGYTIPKPLAEKVLPQLETMSVGPIEEHLFYAPINLFPEGLGDEEKVRLTNLYTEKIGQSVIPAYRALATFFRDEYLPACRSTHGITSVPNGKAYYDFVARKFTTTEMTTDEIFELGKQEVARLLSEMEKVKREVGYEGDIISFFDYVRNKEELSPYTEPQQVIDNFNRIHKQMEPYLAELFDLTPKASFEVRRTEAFREASGSAEYIPGSADGTRPGIFYVPIPNVESYNVYADEDLFLHEAIPGHHYQVSLQQESEVLPKFRRNLWYSSYGEGWALYCESLGKELGLYKDPYQYFGMLSAEMHRAIRLVVDVGIHAKGWTREQAIQYSLENEAEPEASIIAEIERYMAWPGQALSYKIGQLKIIELRQRAQHELGDRFDIRKFHNIVLMPGCVPLAILERMVDDWIAAEKEVETEN